MFQFRVDPSNGQSYQLNSFLEFYGEDEGAQRWMPDPDAQSQVLQGAGQLCHNIESPQCCHAPGSSALGAPDPRRTETFACQASTSRLPEPTPLIVYRAVVTAGSVPICSQALDKNSSVEA